MGADYNPNNHRARFRRPIRNPVGTQWFTKGSSPGRNGLLTSGQAQRPSPTSFLFNFYWIDFSFRSTSFRSRPEITVITPNSGSISRACFISAK